MLASGASLTRKKSADLKPVNSRDYAELADADLSSSILDCRTSLFNERFPNRLVELANPDPALKTKAHHWG
jgi:ribosomal protein L29